ncbi:MAG: hypothetical protein Q4C53_07410 [Clostridia bacterium]|nr:hypothetical protein [Clostridia bacterium]
MKKSLDEYIHCLFGCNFADETFDPEGQEDHLKESWKLMDDYSWADIYPALVQYLQENRHTPAEVINFVNLFIYYEFADHAIDDPIAFVSYLYCMVDMDRYWDEAGELFDGLAIRILTTGKLVDPMENPYYSPLKDERIVSGIAHWKERLRISGCADPQI